MAAFTVLCPLKRPPFCVGYFVYFLTGNIQEGAFEALGIHICQKYYDLEGRNGSVAGISPSSVLSFYLTSTR